MTNDYKIINTTKQRPYTELRKHSGHKRFRCKLVTALFANSKRLPREPLKPPPLRGLRERLKLHQIFRRTPPVEHGLPNYFDKEVEACVVCLASGRRGLNPKRRKPFEELSSNSIRKGKRRERTQRGRYGRKLCKLYHCKDLEQILVLAGAYSCGYIDVFDMGRYLVG